MDNEAECAASGWFDEQALDVESSHAIAPGATTRYVGAESCFDSDLAGVHGTPASSRYGHRTADVNRGGGV